ncbi:peptidase C1B, bleomycin hydrolase [Phycomyces nitens]|nr:peptidase C1B, bleomycin hydrolase [Phycomyces nitens]
MGSQPSKELEYDEKHPSASSCSSSSLADKMANLNLDSSTLGSSTLGSESLTSRSLEKYSNHFWSDRKNQFALNAVVNNDYRDVIYNHRAVLKDNHVFNVKVPSEAQITNQKSSGRCWLFAGTNVMRLAVIKKYKLNDDFELSQNFLFFYDKLEKANWFLEQMIELAETDIDDRVVQYLLQTPVNDGGQWDMLVNIVQKYGVAPKSVYPETFASSSSSRLNWLVQVKLREYAVQIREALQTGVSASIVRVIKEEMMQDIYRILVIFLGEPPSKFDWEINDKEGKVVSLSGLTPKTFFKEVVAYPIGETMSLINDPRNTYSRLYTVARLGNVVGGQPIRYVNTTVRNMKRLAAEVLRSGKPVWFGCDVGQFSSSKYATMDDKIYDYSTAFNLSFGLTKEQRLLYGESMMTHAMVFTGVHLDKDGQPIRWRVENSWGPDTGDKGYWIMTDTWFSEFVYQVVLEKSAVSKDLVAILDTEPSVLPAYDPMGALA